MNNQETNNISQGLDKAYQVLTKTKNDVEKELEALEIRREKIIKKAVEKIDIEKATLLVKLLQTENAIKAIHPELKESYNNKSKWKQKVIWVLKTSNKLMTASVIISKIKEQEPKKDFEITPVIRLTINRMNDKKQIIRFRNEYLKGIHYGLPEWFINEKLIEGYN